MDYVQITDDQREQMLKVVGARTIDDLLKQVPAAIRFKGDLKFAPALDELSLRGHLSELAAKNSSTDQKVCFLGAGVYDHFIPTVVDFLAMKGEFLTAYTPYQAEASQGSLQAFFEFQTMVCQLTGMDVSNASLYEGATATAEAALMALNSTGHREVLVSTGVHPHYRQVLKTYLSDLPAKYIEVPIADGVVDVAALKKLINQDTAAVIVQSPNFLGNLERVQEVSQAAHAVGGYSVHVFNPLSLGIVKQPGQMEVDIAVAEGQPLGIPAQFGGPYLGLFATRTAHVRKMPGRLVGQTVDADRSRAFCLTLQTREQHIRREKATSNVCTNQGLLALRASVYLASMGPVGIREAAQLSHSKAAYLADRLAAAGIKRRFPKTAFFNEILVQLSKPVDAVLQEASKQGILAGYAVGREYPDLKDCLLIAVTEKRTREQIDALVKILSSAK
jgi:glycine dehydrogenase subunit 1